jgi:hypothetical protein
MRYVEYTTSTEMATFLRPSFMPEGTDLPPAEPSTDEEDLP